MPITPLLHITAAYSNAVLVAVLPHISDTAQKLNLPIPQPITIEQVAHFNTSPYADNVGGALWLTNHYLFVCSFGHIDSFRSPDDWFFNQELERVERFAGNNNMTTNAAIELARNSFRKLGYDSENYGVNGLPTKFEPPYEGKRIGHVPFCEVVWTGNKGESENDAYKIQFDIDMHKKEIVGMVLSGRIFWRSNLVIDVKPEPQIQGKWSVRTNAPNVISH